MLNFQLKYFLGDNENAIKIQIWCCLIANLLMMILHNRIKKRRKGVAFSSIVSFIRLNIHSYVSLIEFMISDMKELEGKRIRDRCDGIQLSLW
ncbi:MAG: hypothetical protein N2203_08675 [Bacteroidia bacterium]|nr:hypothetical protein [Bacteroidia bacterium]